MGIRWSYIVEYLDRNCQVLQRERFLFPNDAKTRAEQLLQAGFYGVRCKQRRVRAGGPATDTRPGIYRHGSAIAGMDFLLKTGQMRR